MDAWLQETFALLCDFKSEFLHRVAQKIVKRNVLDWLEGAFFRQIWVLF
jgi:hypothetical protein